jgi:predicted ATPase
LSHRLDLLNGGRDAETRQRTLRAAIEWSHDLLTAEEKRLFRRLSVFDGGCDLEAAEEVAEADLDMTQSLIGKSLARQSHDRIWMLETIREFALERLQESSDRERIPQLHADHYLVLAESIAANESERGPDGMQQLGGRP